MKFQKGDMVEVWDNDGKFFTKAEYFGFNDHPEVKYPHVVRLYKEDGTTEPNIYCYRNCRHVRPNLEKDDPVWIMICNEWMPRHFHEWTEDGKMKYFINGYTSHTTRCYESEIANIWSL